MKTKNRSPFLLDKVVYVAAERLRHHPKNPRKHSDKQVALIAASIGEHGFAVPILIDENFQILAGHGRLLAAQKIGMKKVPTIQVTHLNEAQKLALLIADNKLTELAQWDLEQLAVNFEELHNLDFNVELTAFSTAEIDRLMDVPSNENKKEEPVELPADNYRPVSKIGDLWLLGEHRLLCGDAKKAKSYEMLMSGRKAQMVFSDPPYNVPIDGHVCGLGKVKHAEFLEASGEMSPAQFTKFLRAVFMQTQAFSLDGSIHYYFMDWRHIGEITQAGTLVFGGLKQLAVWNKDNGGMGSFYRSKHELVFIFKNGDASHINNFKMGEEGRYRTNVWDYPGVNTLKRGRIKELELHPTVKPIGLVSDAIRDCSKRGGIVLDPFCGSGTTIIAAEQTGRVCYAMELDSRYVDTAIKRWQEKTGQAAKLAGCGTEFAEIARDRLNPGGGNHE